MDDKLSDGDRALSSEELKEVYEANLRDEHAAMLAAMEGEFNVSGEDVDNAVIAGKARKAVMDAVPDASEALKYLVNHAKSEAVKANMVKFVIAEALKIAGDSDETDPLNKLLKKLKSNDKVTPNSGTTEE